MLRVAVLVTPPELAVIVAEVFAVTEVVSTVKLAEFATAVTVTLDGTIAIEGLLLVNVTRCPFAGAGPLWDTVPVDGFPPLTVEGESVSVARLGELIVKSVVLVLPEYDAEMVAVVELETGEVTI